MPRPANPARSLWLAPAAQHGRPATSARRSAAQRAQLPNVPACEQTAIEDACREIRRCSWETAQCQLNRHQMRLTRRTVSITMARRRQAPVTKLRPKAVNTSRKKKYCKSSHTVEHALSGARASASRSGNRILSDASSGGGSRGTRRRGGAIEGGLASGVVHLLCDAFGDASTLANGKYKTD